MLFCNLRILCICANSQLKIIKTLLRSTVINCNKYIYIYNFQDRRINSADTHIYIFVYDCRTYTHIYVHTDNIFLFDKLIIVS